MKVLHVCENLPGGTSSYLQEILPAQISKYGHQNIRLLAPADQRDYLTLSEGFGFVGYRREGRDTFSLVRLAVALRRLLREFRPDILHLHSSLAGAVGRVVALSSAFEGRVVYCAHGWAIDPYRRSRGAPLLTLIEAALYSATDAIINISPHEEQFLPAGWRRNSKLHLIQSGIATRADEPKEHPFDASQETRPWRLLFAGRTDYQKGFDLLLREMAQLGEKARLRVAGDHIVGDDCSSPPLPNVTMLGWLPRADVADEMRNADFVVMPSRWEGMPLVALESMRAGRAVIASDRGPFPHIIEHNRTGLLVDIDEPGFLARALAGLQKREAQRMGREANEVFSGRFTEAEMNNRLLELYRDLTIAPAERLRLPLPGLQTARGG